MYYLLRDLLALAGSGLLLNVRRVGDTPFTKLKKFPVMLTVGGLGLGVNYITFLSGLELGGPLTAAIMIQTGPLMLAVLGVLLFKELLNKRQIFAIVLASFGFVLFYRDRLAVANVTGLQTNAALLVIVAGIAWVIFCIGQKRTGPVVGSTLPNLVAYALSSVLLIFCVDWQAFEHVLSVSFLSVLYLSLATLVAYGALGEAIRVLPVSIVSLFVVTNPFVTIFVVELLAFANITYFGVVPLTSLGYIGTFCAIVGVALATAKFPKRRFEKKQLQES